MKVVVLILLFVEEEEGWGIIIFTIFCCLKVEFRKKYPFRKEWIDRSLIFLECCSTNQKVLGFSLQFSLLFCPTKGVLFHLFVTKRLTMKCERLQLQVFARANFISHCIRLSRFILVIRSILNLNLNVLSQVKIKFCIYVYFCIIVNLSLYSDLVTQGR